VTALSARRYSASDSRRPLAQGEVQIWLCARAVSTDSDSFLRDLLSRFTGLAPLDQRIGRGECGKPFLLDRRYPLEFSLSHSGDWIACALACSTPLGLDLQICKPDRQVMRLARRYFSEAECSALTAVEGEARTQLFYDLWALKGRDGLPLITPNFSSKSAYYALVQALPGYALALCRLQEITEPPLVRLFTLDEPARERELPVSLRASSHC
jgi:hypothetical protein